MKKNHPKTSESIPRSRSCAFIALSASFFLSGCLTTAYSAGFEEPFDIEAQPLDGSGAETKDRAILETANQKGHLVLRGTRAEPAALFKVIGEGSLEYRDSHGKTYPSKGNRLHHTDDEMAHFTIGYALDLENYSLVAGRVEGGGPQGEGFSPERHRVGWGAPNSTLWFSSIIRPNSGLLELHLRNSTYSTGPNGLYFFCTPGTGELTVRQNWLVLGPHSELQASLFINPGEPAWIVAKIETGPEWGHSEAYATIHPGQRWDEVALPEPTGRLTVWVNPPIGEEPDPSTAAATFPLHEMRFDALWVVLKSGAEVDEIRIDPDFSAIISP